MSTPGRRLSLLYVEDNSDDADLTRSHFELNAPDFELEIVDSGHRCLERLQTRKYDALLLDNKLRDFSASDLLRELSSRKIFLPVVVVTGAGDEELVVQILRLGAVDYIPKQSDYIEFLPGILRNAVRDFPAFHNPERESALRHRRILYVECQSADIDLTLKHFNDFAPHLRLEIARSAADALSRMRDGVFDLVLTDLRLPDMNALDLMRQTRQMDVHTPFVVITGKGDESAAAAALKLGAYDYLVKREDYLLHLPYAIDHAIARSELAQTNRRLQAELAERFRAEAEKARLLEEMTGQRQRLDEIVDSVPGFVWESWGSPVNSTQRFDFVSRHIEKILGYSATEWLSTPNLWSRVMHPDDRERAVREAVEFFNAGRGGLSQFRCITKDGREVWVESLFSVICDEAGAPTGMRGVTMDITKRKEAEQERMILEEQLRQAQKIESVGRLAGGVAHDFNNLLTVINGYSDLMMQKLAPADPLHTSISQINRAGKRAAELTRQLLAFSRRQLLQPRVLGLNSLIDDSSKMLKRLLGEDIELTTVLAPDLGCVHADAGQMDQVILNLAVNARDAMPRGGRLILETRNVELDGEFANTHLSSRPGSYVMLAVSDSGCGMDQKTLARVFEPFFTTKETGKGTGLGLSTVYGIVQQSGGSIWVYSEPGQGTTFKIYLPRIADPVVKEEESFDNSNSPRGSETVLVVEDEAMVRSLACDALRQHGYDVIEAANAGEALLACERRSAPISLMITDVVMPQMSGTELAERLRRFRPEMKTLYMSGYTDDSVVRHGLLDPAVFFLEKPFTPSMLAQKVRDVLGSPTIGEAEHG